MRRTCRSVILPTGLLMVVVPLAFRLPGNTSSTRHLTDSFRPTSPSPSRPASGVTSR